MWNFPFFRANFAHAHLMRRTCSTKISSILKYTPSQRRKNTQNMKQIAKAEHFKSKSYRYTEEEESKNPPV